MANDFPKMSSCIFRKAIFTVTLILINTTCKNNAKLEPTLKGLIRHIENLQKIFL